MNENGKEKMIFFMEILLLMRSNFDFLLENDILWINDCLINQDKYFLV
ncbi:MAG: hypothetical protein ACTSXU_13615 [Promethearchaeota archaeon]